MNKEIKKLLKDLKILVKIEEKLTYQVKTGEITYEKWYFETFKLLNKKWIIQSKLTDLNYFIIKH